MELKVNDVDRIIVLKSLCPIPWTVWTHCRVAPPGFV